jgi:hypothetical protein
MRRGSLTMRAIVGLVVSALVVLLARSIGYALEPGPESSLLQQRAGGPALPVLVLVCLALGGAVAIVICWLAALGVRERQLVERRPLAAPVRRFRVGRALALALALSLTASVAGGLLEAYIHWRAGLGWHGLHCIVGPVHRDLLPIETMLSVVAAAVVAAAEHVLAWMRRTFASLRDLPLQHVSSRSFRPSPSSVLRSGRWPALARPRAPPGLS